ncbi:hypothetical protein Tco_1490707 [Tanacetum coccineum]
MVQMMIKNHRVEQDRGLKEEGQKRTASTSAPVKRTTKTEERYLYRSKSHKNLLANLLRRGKLCKTTDVFAAPAHQEFDTGVHDEQAEEEVQHLPDWFQQPTRLPSPDLMNKSVPDVHESVQHGYAICKSRPCTDKSKITRKQSKHGHENQKSAKPKPQKIQSLSQFSSTRTNLAIFEKHAEYDESNTYVLERFNTTAGNPVKKILLKLNLSDHRLFKDGWVEVPDSQRLTIHNPCS